MALDEEMFRVYATYDNTTLIASGVRMENDSSKVCVLTVYEAGGSYVILKAANQTSFWIGSTEYQDQTIGTRFDGTFGNVAGTGTGTGVSTVANAGQFFGMKMESNAVAFDTRDGSGTIVDS